MPLPTPVTAAIVGAVVAGIISGVLNLISLGIQYLMNEKHEKNIIKREWRRETVRLLRELKREIMRFDPSTDGEDFNLIDSLVDDVEDQNALVPSDIDDDAVVSVLSEVVLAHERKNGASYYDSIYKYRAELLDKTEVALDEIEE